MEDNLLPAISKQLFLEFNVVAKTFTYSAIVHIGGLDQAMCQVVACNRLKTMENYETVSPESN